VLPPPQEDEIALAAAWIRAQASLLPNGAANCAYLADAIERGAHLNAHDAELVDDVLTLLPVDPERDPERVALAAAVRQACDSFAIHPRDLLGPYRYAFLTPARFAVYSALFDLGWKIGRIGRVLGKDHRSIRNGLERSDIMAERDAVYRRKRAKVAAAAKEKTL
jgi:hypothetical protein